MQSRLFHTFYSGDDRDLTGVVCEYIEEVTLLCMDQLREGVEGSLIESEFSDLLEEAGSCERIRPELSELIFGPEKLRHLCEHTVEELLMRHRLAIWTPERCCHHRVDLEFFAIAEFYLHGFLYWSSSSCFSSSSCIIRCFFFSFFFSLGLGSSDLLYRYDRVAIPLRISKLERCIHEVEYSEVGLPFKKSSPTAYDLLELYHRVHRPEEDYVADIASVDSCRELL